MAGTNVTAIPAQYAKFLTAVLGEAIAYVQLYGTTWHLDAALVMAGAALAVLGVPNASAPTVPQQTGSDTYPGIRPPDPPSGAVKVTPPPPASIV